MFKSYFTFFNTPCAEPFKPYRVAISAQNNNTGEVNTDIVFSREGSEFMQISQGIDFIILPGAGYRALICQWITPGLQWRFSAS